MPATVQIHEMTGASAGTNKTSSTVRFKTADNTTVDTNDRIQVPADYQPANRSYTKQLRFYFQSAPSVDIQNLRAYPDAANNFGTGISVNCAASGSWGSNYITPLVSGVNLWNYSSGSPIDLDTVNTGPHTGTGYKGDFLVLQMVVASGASSGQLTAETLTFAYDET